VVAVTKRLSETPKSFINRSQMVVFPTAAGPEIAKIKLILWQGKIQ